MPLVSARPREWRLGSRVDGATGAQELNAQTSPSLVRSLGRRETGERRGDGREDLLGGRADVVWSSLVSGCTHELHP